MTVNVLDQSHGENWTLYNADSCRAISGITDNSMGMSVFSPPFSQLYIYSSSIADMGNSEDHREFFEHYRYLVPELYRITKPGRLCVVHCKDLPLYKGRDGAMGLYEFPDEIMRVHREAGWVFHSRVTIWKDPVTEMQRTKNHGLLYKELCKDSCGSRQGMADYLLVFRKWEGEFADPVNAGEERFQDYVGFEPPDAGQIAEYAGVPGPMRNPKTGRWPSFNPFPEGTEAHRSWSIQVWQRYASPVWMDIDQMDVLNYRIARTDEDEKHICVARDSLVLTQDGHIPIQDVEVGSMVLTHLGRWRRVNAKACMGVKPVVKLEAQGVADLKVTPDHKLWARSCAGHGGGLGGRWKPGTMGVSGHRRNARTSTPQWMQAQDAKSSYVNLKLPPTEDSAYSSEEWWLIGRWLGDGHIDTRGRVHVTCSFEETDELVATIGSRAGFVAKTQTAAQVSIKDLGGRIRRMLARCGRGASGKKLPIEALALDSEKAESLLSGYLSADGHYVAKHDRWTASSVSRPLLLGMAMVAQRARGVVASVYAGRPAGTCVIEGRTVNTRQDWILSIPPRNVSAMILDDGGWKKVRHVEPAGDLEVWDLQVEEDESFTVEGCIVHNCPLQLPVIERCVRLWTNPGDVVFSPFAGVGSEIFASVRCGRKGLGIELKPEYFKQATAFLELLEAEMNRPSLLDGLTVHANGKDA